MDIASAPEAPRRKPNGSTPHSAPSHRIVIPARRKRGGQSAKAKELYGTQRQAFCAGILQIRSTIDFDVSARGWCYLLEEHGLTKGEFNDAQELINDCRKAGLLPINICCADERRSADNEEDLHHDDPAEYAGQLIEGVRSVNGVYTPFSFWDAQDIYVEMVVEKIDLKNLFNPVCKEYYMRLANNVGWGDLNQRAELMKRFQYWEEQSKRCVLLYCGDHDPGGLHISDFIRTNMEEISSPVGWRPDNLIIDRFGLNYDFIIEQGLSWIENLETSSGKRLNDPNHPDHKTPYVQTYLKRFGARKVEANALVIRPQAARDLCRAAINQYVPETAPADYRAALKPKRDELLQIVEAILGLGEDA
jgi:hypothetical protein